ncbi:MAG: cyclic nucleotide-binding domain-containing protein, partial [Myxococcales bacterium]|nr:cyclic nucleotide-binding domain-containing protein [Myxococcales bacterium]
VRRLVANTFRTTPAFMALADPTRHDVAHLFELRSAEEGTTIMAEGKKADGLYVLISGEVDITSGGRTRRGRAGELYGLSALFSSAPSDTTVRALGEAFVLRLPAVRFKMRVIEDAKDVEALKRVAAGLYDW